MRFFVGIWAVSGLDSVTATEIVLTFNHRESFMQPVVGVESIIRERGRLRILGHPFANKLKTTNCRHHAPPGGAGEPAVCRVGYSLRAF